MGLNRTALLLASAFLLSVPTIAAAQRIDVLGVEVEANVDLGGGIGVDASVDVGVGGDSLLGVDATVDLGGGNEGGGLDSALDSILGPNGLTGSNLTGQVDTLIALGATQNGAGGINADIDALMALGGTPGAPIGGLTLDDIVDIVFAAGSNGAAANLAFGAGNFGNTGIDLDLSLLALGGVGGGPGGPAAPGSPSAPGTPGSPGPPVIGGPGGAGGGGPGGGGPGGGGPGVVGGVAVPSSLLTLWASLNGDQQNRLVGQCLTILSRPADFRRNWVDLCHNVRDLPGVQPVFVALR